MIALLLACQPDISIVTPSGPDPMQDTGDTASPNATSQASAPSSTTTATGCCPTLRAR